jgi:dephospho-CoA kinase
MTKTYFITGAEGTGKTSIIPYLKEKLLDLDIHDFDEVGVPLNPPLKWRLDTTLYWIKKAIQNQKKEISTCIIGLSFPKEINEFKESKKINKIDFLLLDVNIKERERRLKKRKSSKEVIKDLEQLKELKKQFKNKKVINTSKLSIEETAKKIIKYLKK